MTTDNEVPDWLKALALSIIGGVVSGLIVYAITQGKLQNLGK